MPQPDRDRDAPEAAEAGAMRDPEANPYAPPLAPLDRPPLVLPLAPLGLRAVARIVDLVVQYGPVAVTVVVVEVVMATDGPFAVLTGALVGVLGALVALGVLVGQCWMLWTRSQSLGKRLLGLRIVRTDGRPADPAMVVFVRTLGVAFLKSMGNGLFCGLPVLSVFDLAFLLGQERRALHDYLAGTVVIREEG